MFELEGKRDGEEIIEILKRHPMSMYWAIYWIFGMILVIISVSLLLVYGSISVSHFLVILLVSLLFAVGSVCYCLFIWKNNYYILTNYRLVNVKQVDLFKKSVTETDLGNIQEVSYKKFGVMSNLFDIGEIVVQTAGPNDDITMKLMSNPAAIQKEITNIRAKYLIAKGVHIDNSNLNKEQNNEQSNQTPPATR